MKGYNVNEALALKRPHILRLSHVMDCHLLKIERSSSFAYNGVIDCTDHQGTNISNTIYFNPLAPTTSI